MVDTIYQPGDALNDGGESGEAGESGEGGEGGGEVGSPGDGTGLELRGSPGTYVKRNWPTAIVDGTTTKVVGCADAPSAATPSTKAARHSTRTGEVVGFIIERTLQEHHLR
jgi:hypothetical protein